MCSLPVFNYIADMTTAQEEFNELMRDKDTLATHPEDVSDRASFLNLSDSDREGDNDIAASTHRGYLEDDNPRPSLSQARNTIPLTRYEANTGPKGVIADAQRFRDSRRLHRESMRNHEIAAAQRLGNASIPLGPTFTAKGVDERQDEDDDLFEILEEDGEEDDEFMQSWRLDRLKQMQSAADSNIISSLPHKGRTWAGLLPVDGAGYLDAIDGSPQDTVVVVYIYDDESEVSLAIEDCLADLAQVHQDVRFVKLHFEDAEMEPAGVPALLAYRAGDKFAGLVPVVDEIPDDAELSAQTLEAVLRRHQILR